MWCGVLVTDNLSLKQMAPFIVTELSGINQAANEKDFFFQTIKIRLFSKQFTLYIHIRININSLGYIHT